jgi:hypothetical protein
MDIGDICVIGEASEKGRKKGINEKNSVGKLGQ